MYSEITVVKLNTIAHEYKDSLYQELLSVLSQPRFKNTGKGVESLHVDVIDGDGSKAPQIIITIADHIILLDKRKMQWTKLPDMKNLIEWASTRTFDKTPGYEGATSIDSLKSAQRVAWAVAMDKKKKDTWKPKLWRKKTLGGVLREMNKAVLAAFDQAIEEDLKKAVA